MLLNTTKSYLNTIIYKIYCKNVDIQDCYVGHTTNFTNRKYQHINACSNLSLRSRKLYKTIIENGGWDNWDFEILEKCSLRCLREALMKEFEYYKKLSPSLNSVPPCSEKYVELHTYSTAKISKYNNYFKNTLCNEMNNYKTEKCYNCSCGKSYKHNSSLCAHKKKCLYIKDIINNEEIVSNKYKFLCEKCNFKCNKLSNYNKHITTKKHKINKKYSNNKNKTCNTCGKLFSSRSGLWYHKTVCFKKNIEQKSNELHIIHNLKKVNDNLEFMKKNMDLDNTSNFQNNLFLEKIYTIIDNQNIIKEILQNNYYFKNTLCNEMNNYKTEKCYNCSCGKTYKHQSTLCAHKKKCTFISKTNNDCDEENFFELLKQS